MISRRAVPPVTIGADGSPQWHHEHGHFFPQVGPEDEETRDLLTTSYFSSALPYVRDSRHAHPKPDRVTEGNMIALSEDEIFKALDVVRKVSDSRVAMCCADKAPFHMPPLITSPNPLPMLYHRLLRLANTAAYTAASRDWHDRSTHLR
jgi:hypothetical protein